jgi:hypothetical protein
MVPPGEKKDVIEKMVEINDPTVYNEMQRQATHEMHHTLIAFLYKRGIRNPSPEQLTNLWHICNETLTNSQKDKESEKEAFLKINAYLDEMKAKKKKPDF